MIAEYTYTYTYTYTRRNQHTTVTDHLDARQNSVYQYDANGNQIVKSQNGTTTQFNYDVRNQLRQIHQGSTDLGRYHYDYQGLRIKKTGDQGELRYTYDNQSVLTQSNASGTTVAKYDYGPTRLLSLKHTSEGRQYYHFDALGSPIALTKTDASVQARYHYDAWGHYRNQTGSSHNRFGFTGHEHDKNTGLIYAKARYYDPSTGRFLSQDAWAGDPSIAPSLHKYLYAYANPTVYWDPDGNEPFKWVDEDGYTHFSDRPDPEGIPQENVTEPGRPQTKTERLIAQCQSAGGTGCAFSVDKQLSAENASGKSESGITGEDESGQSSTKTNSFVEIKTPGQIGARNALNDFEENGQIAGDISCDLNPLCSVQAAVIGELPSGQKLAGWEQGIVLLPGGLQILKNLKKFVSNTAKPSQKVLDKLSDPKFKSKRGQVKKGSRLELIY